MNFVDGFVLAGREIGNKRRVVERNVRHRIHSWSTAEVGSVALKGCEEVFSVLKEWDVVFSPLESAVVELWKAENFGVRAGS